MQLGKFVKQPDEYLGYDILYTEFLDVGDYVAAIEKAEVSKYTSDKVDVNDMVVDTKYLLDNGTRVKVYLRGGITGEGYKVTLRVRTNQGLVKEDEFKVKIKDY
jgi:hypothetical protein